MLAAVLAVSVPNETVRIEAPGQYVPKDNLPTVEITSGASVPITVILAHLEKPDVATYSLFEISPAFKVASTVIKDQPCSVTSGKMGETALGIKVDLPKSSVTNRYRLRLLTQIGKKSEWSVEDLDLFSYPSDLPEQLQTAVRNFEKESGEQIGVFGPGRKVRTLLNTWKIPFREYDPYGTRMSVVIGDYIDDDIDADHLPAGSAVNGLFLNTTRQLNHPGDYTRAVIQDNGKTVYASSAHFKDIAESPAAQYEFYTLLTGILPHPNP